MDDKTILLVDDEQNILRAFNRLFMDSEYNILLASSGEEALKIMEEQKIDLILSDMKMPFMDGYELLTIVKERYPYVLRIILSGFSERETMIQCIQKNLAMAYLLKPWNNEQLLLTIDNLFQMQQALKTNGLEEIASFLQDDSAIPGIVYDELLSQIEQGVELETIVETVEKDFILSLIILNFANSTFCGNDISSVKKALQYLNLEELKNIILSRKLTQTINGDEKVNKLKDFLWKHAGLSNKITHFIYKEIIRKEIPENYRLAGILYNIGKIALLKKHKGEYVELFNKSISKNISIVDLENERYGINHQEVGRYLLSWWGIPYPVMEASSYHHVPLSPKIVNKELITITYIAEYYAWILMGYKPPQECSDKIYNNIGTTRDICDTFIFNNFYVEELESSGF